MPGPKHCFSHTVGLPAPGATWRPTLRESVMTRSAVAGTITAVLGPLVAAATRQPDWITSLVFALAFITLVVQLRIQLRLTSVDLRVGDDALISSNTRRQRIAALEDEAVAAARAVTDPAQRAEILLAMLALRQPPPEQPPGPP